MRSTVLVILCAMFLVPAAARAQEVLVTKLADTLWRVSSLRGNWNFHARGPRPTPSEAIAMARGEAPRAWVRSTAGGSGNGYHIDYHDPAMMLGGGSSGSGLTRRDRRLSDAGDDCWSIIGFGPHLRGPEPTADEIDAFLRGRVPRAWKRKDITGGGTGAGARTPPGFVYEGFEREPQPGTGTGSGGSMLGVASAGVESTPGTGTSSGGRLRVRYANAAER